MIYVFFILFSCVRLSPSQDKSMTFSKTAALKQGTHYPTKDNILRLELQGITIFKNHSKISCV